MPSPEYLALKALDRPQTHGTGDMWLCRRLGIVIVFNGHKRGRGGPKRARPNSFHLYHWGKPDMVSRPSDWRDDDANAHSLDPTGARHPEGEKWEYVGNMFEMLPYSSFVNP